MYDVDEYRMYPAPNSLSTRRSGFMAPLLLALILSGRCFASTLDITVSGTTATQAVVAYTPPDTSTCSIAVSETADASGNPQAPLVHDVDTRLFPGADQDNRPGNLFGNGTRVCVIGRRDAERATDGHYYSRALQANTVHYGKIACGASTALFTFQTTNIPLGLGYSDPWPTDPAAPGEWAAPSSPGSIGETFVEPQTGAQIVRMTYPGFGWQQQLNRPFNTAYNQGQLPCDSAGPWTNPCNAFTTKSVASVGRSTAWLVLRNNSFSFGYGGSDPTYGFTLTQFQLSMRAAATLSGEQLDVCLSMNAGASCASPIQIVDLPTRPATITVGSNNPGAVGIDPWLFDSNPHISRWEASTATGRVTVTGATATRTSGAYFSNSWTTGGSGRIRLSTVSTTDACANGTEIGMSGGGASLTLASAPGDGSYYYCAPDFAVMVRRHGDGAGNSGTVSLNNAKFATLTGDAGGNAGSGSTNICATSLVGGGYLCMVPVAGGAADLSWTDPATGTTNMLGALQLNGKGTGTDQWRTYTACPPGSPATFSTIDDTQTTTPTWFCVANDKAGKTVVFQVQYTGPLTAQSFQNEGGIGTTFVSSDNYSATYTNAVITDLTPSSLGKDVLSQMNAFSGQTVDPAMACHSGPVQQGKFLIYCYYGQDTLAWFAVFDPGDRDPAHAGQPGGPRIVGTMSSWNGGPGAANRWAVNHAVTDYGCCSGYFGFSASSIPAGTNTVGHTAVMVTTNDAISGTAKGCATYGNPLGFTGPNCTLININANAGSYEPYYWTSVGSQGQTPGVPSIAQVGDLFCITDSVSSCRALSAGPYNPVTNPNGSRETVQLIQKNANGHWVFLRNAPSLIQGAIAIPGAGTKYLVAQSGAITTALPYPGYPSSNGMLGGSVFWDYAHDPLGQNTLRDPQFYDAHSSTRPQVTIEAGNYPFSPWAANYRVRHAASLPELFNAPVSLVASNPSFQGINGPALSNVWQSHPSVAGDNSTANESQAAFDLRPLEGFYGTAPNNADLYTNVSGQLWMVTYTASGPDTLSGGTITLNRKIFATAASSGMHPLIDVSGPGSVIDDTAANSYKYCIVRKAGECVSGSRVGQIYVNAPGVVYPFCQGNNVSGQTIPQANDICVSNMPAAGDGLIQFSTLYQDPNGAYARVLVKSLSGKVKSFIGTGGLMPLPSGWIAFNANYLDSLSRQNFLVKLPPFPTSDGLDRNTFLSMPLNLKPPTGLGVTNAIVEFGYQEFNGYCTTRKETCVADAPAVGAAPFHFEGENPAGAPCSSTCTIAIPAASQRILYYQVKYRDASNHVAAQTPLQVVATP